MKMFIDTWKLSFLVVSATILPGVGWLTICPGRVIVAEEEAYLTAAEVDNSASGSGLSD